MAYVVIPAIWAKGWIIPGVAETAVRRATTTKPDPHPDPPMSKAMLVWRCVWTAGVLAACLIFAYSPSNTAKAAIFAR
jgi:hypothetical protein